MHGRAFVLDRAGGAVHVARTDTVKRQRLEQSGLGAERLE